MLFRPQKNTLNSQSILTHTQRHTHAGLHKCIHNLHMDMHYYEISINLSSNTIQGPRWALPNLTSCWPLFSHNARSLTFK
jgi:hypothetical protein